ncbi:metallopeptidase TldD-related protein [Streptomyces sp. NPDC008001]|uniref:metallopeptidase TldD-related protein n=1 Tax=Streptomyces sp. NPDC008001 TaxID=3364804 RepID=UPI0036EEB152
MPADTGPGETVACERAVGGLLTAGPRGTSARRMVTHMGRHDRGGDRGTRIFSGAAPGPWRFDVPEPEPPDDPDEVVAALTALRRRFGGRAVLQYSQVSAVRVVAGTAHGTAAPQARRVWSLTGDLLTPGGHEVPVGRSGRGPALPRLTDPAWCESAARLLAAVDAAREPAPGEYAAVLLPQAAGLLLHEAAGHFAEAPPGGTPALGHRLGCRVAGELITLDDDPLAEGGPARYDTDDEGIVSLGPQRIVHEGRLVRQLHSLASAAAAAAMPTASSRAASVLHRPVPRMSNVVCRPGDAGTGELVENAGHGILVHRLADGIRTGATLEARLVLGERIRSGRRTGQYVRGRIRERADVLTRVVETGAHAEFGDNALCGKAGQLLFDVGMCAPALRLSRLRCTP